MSQISDIKEQINDLITFKHISAAFTEAAAVKLKNIRSAFERNDHFFEEITHIYHLVEINVRQANINMNAASPSSSTSTRKLSVAFTSNQRFFGSINNEIMNYLLQNSKRYQTERFVIGTTGINYLRAINFKEKFNTLQFAQDTPDQKEIEEFLNITVNFGQVTIYYPRFVSFLKQEVGSVNLTRKIPPVGEKEKEKLKEEINLIFEPELSKMIKFFDTEVRSILFKRVLLETNLARTAARLLSMSQAEERTDYEIKAKKSELKKVIRSHTNTKLLDTFSGIKKWKHSISTRRTMAEMKNKVFFLESPQTI